MGIESSIIIFFIGLLSSLLGSLLGIGGGVIIVPAFVIIFKYPIQNAVAISLSTIVATSVITTARNIKKGIPNIKIGLELELITALTAIAGGFIAINIDPKIIQTLFSLLLISIAYLMLKRKKSKNYFNTKGEFEYFDPKLNKTIAYNVENMRFAFPISAFAGIASGMFGIGGGMFKVPVLNSVCKIPMRAASATSAFMVGITASAGAYVYFRHGYADVDSVFLTLLGVVVGSKLGLYISDNMKNEMIEKVFVFVIVLLALEMLIRTYI